VAPGQADMTFGEFSTMITNMAGGGAGFEPEGIVRPSRRQ